MVCYNVKKNSESLNLFLKYFCFLKRIELKFKNKFLSLNICKKLFSSYIIKFIFSIEIIPLFNIFNYSKSFIMDFFSSKYNMLKQFFFSTPRHPDMLGWVIKFKWVPPKVHMIFEKLEYKQEWSKDTKKYSEV